MAASLNGTRQDGRAPELAGPPAPLSWREERRLDRLAAARSAREDRRADTEARIAESDARDRRRREDQRARSDARRAARYQRAARRASRAAWLREHVTGLLFVPVIAVPGLLAWTAMAAYGSQVFGPAGVTLPAFSEGAMWAFAGATTITRRRHPERPVWHLRLGTVVFAGFGAVLNFAHGLTAGSVITGVVMALISVAGVTAHQLITAGPRRTRVQREISRASRAAERRERATARAALRRATAEVGEDGSVRLVHSPGMVTLDRDLLGRARVTPVFAAEVTPQALADLRAELGEARAKADAIEVALRGEISALESGLETAETARREAEEKTAAAEALAEDFARRLEAAERAAADRGPRNLRPQKPRRGPGPVRLGPAEARAKAAEILAAEPGISGADLGERVGRTARWGQDFRQERAPKGQGE